MRYEVDVLLDATIFTGDAVLNRLCAIDANLRKAHLVQSNAASKKMALGQVFKLQQCVHKGCGFKFINFTINRCINFCGVTRDQSSRYKLLQL